MERQLGHDLSQVKVHTGPVADDSAAALGAVAYTVGKHIVLGAAAAAPATEQDRATLRHELVHTIQQPDGAVSSPLVLTEPNDQFEVEASAIGREPVAPSRSSLQRAGSPMLARQPASGAQRSKTTGYRPVAITIGGSPVGETITFSYPDDNERYYVVPLYAVTVRGTDGAGTPVQRTFKALRFGVYYRKKRVGVSKSTGPFVAGRAEAQKHTASFRDDYEVHSADSDEPMAWDLGGGFLIHDGPDVPVDPAKFNPDDLGKESDPASPGENLYATIGCIEITGDHGFTKFNELIIALSGSALTGPAALNEIAAHRLVQVTYEKARRPQLKLWKR